MKLNLKALLGADFGKLDPSLNVVFTLKGIGVKTAEGQVAVLNKDTKEITLVPMELAIGDFPAFAVPSQSIEIGDLVIQNRNLKFVTGKDEDGILTVTNYKNQTEERLVPTKTMLGYVAAAKVISPFGDIASVFGGAEGKIDEKTMLMLTMLGGDDDDLSGMLPLILMGGLGGKAEDGKPAAIDEKTLLMFAMMGNDDGDGDLKSLLPLILMGGLGGQAGAISPLMLLMFAKGGL